MYRNEKDRRLSWRVCCQGAGACEARGIGGAKVWCGERIPFGWTDLRAGLVRRCELDEGGFHDLTLITSSSTSPLEWTPWVSAKGFRGT